MESPRLRATERCVVDDLGLNANHHVRDARHYCAEHEALRAFVVKRAGMPGGGEPIKDVGRHGLVKSLHVGRARGATLWDAENDVCWLLAYGATHATHEKRDVYKHFMALHDRQELLPTASDYEALFRTFAVNLLDGIAATAEDIYGEARAHPRAAVHRSYGDGEVRMLVDLLVIDDAECEEGWLCLTFPWEAMPLETEIIDLVGRLLPDAVDLDTLQLISEFDHQQLDPNQIGFTWSVLPEG